MPTPARPTISVYSNGDDDGFQVVQRSSRAPKPLKTNPNPPAHAAQAALESSHDSDLLDEDEDDSEYQPWTRIEHSNPFDTALDTWL